MLTQPRMTRTRNGDLFGAPIAGGTSVFTGSIVALDAEGNLVPGQISTTLTRPGLCMDTANNAGAAGDMIAEYDVAACAQFKNSGGGDEITRADIGKDCFIIDDETVAKTDGASTRSRAGIVADVDDGGVWVQF